MFSIYCCWAKNSKTHNIKTTYILRLFDILEVGVKISSENDERFGTLTKNVYVLKASMQFRFMNYIRTYRCIDTQIDR